MARGSVLTQQVPPEVATRIPLYKDLDNLDYYITIQQMIDATLSAVPAGSIQMFGGASPPTGWGLCDGTAISRTTYSGLFAIVGTTFGAGDGSTTFNKPDFRGVFPKGAGTTNRAAGVDANGGAYAGVNGTYSQDQSQGHLHNYEKGNAVFKTSASGTPNTESSTTTTTPTTSEITDGSNGTPRTGVTTEPQSLGVNFIIKE